MEGKLRIGDSKVLESRETIDGTMIRRRRESKDGHRFTTYERIEMPPLTVTKRSGNKEIFDRVVDYFESDLPYLRGNLVIEDLVKVVYANKLYISRAIGRCAGRNFCQFVNYYRVRHSVDVFRQNPDLKVIELAGQCGFNSVVSFTMAFKLYMNENPSDWIRKERSRMIKFGQ